MVHDIYGTEDRWYTFILSQEGKEGYSKELVQKARDWFSAENPRFKNERMITRLQPLAIILGIIVIAGLMFILLTSK